MTKDEALRQIQHKRDAVSSAQAQLRQAECNLRAAIKDLGLVALGLKVGDEITAKNGADHTYIVTGATEYNFSCFFVAPTAKLIKKDGTIGAREWPAWCEWKRVEEGGR